MNSRERVIASINHQTPDRVPIDIGATAQTGINASTLYKLRTALGLEQRPVTVHEPFQMLGLADADVLWAMGVDVIGLNNPVNFLGNSNKNWKPWKMPDGTPVLMAGDFAFKTGPDGSCYAFPQGDTAVSPSVRMPAGGFFFDNIERSSPFDENNPDPRGDFKDSFSVFDDETAQYLENESRRLYETTNYAIVGNFGGGGFGDVAALPGPFMKTPRGIRRIEDWLMAHMLYPGYVREAFELQAEIAIKNLEIYKQAVGNRIHVVWISGTDFGTQNGEMISADMYRDLYKPFHKRLNDWVHRNTGWKTFYHCCGSIVNLLDDMVDAGIDILNPVQCSAAGMDPAMLKKKYGDKLVFWGGGVDTQHTLPFGTPEQVRDQVLQRCGIFSRNGGFVFNTIHNIMAQTPVRNIIAMLDAVKEFNERNCADTQKKKTAGERCAVPH